MKLELELKPGDVVLLKILACVLILFFMARFLIFPGVEKHQDLVSERDDLQVKQEEMQYTMDSASTYESMIDKQQKSLDEESKGFYDLLQNQQIDELVSGLALKHDLFPMYLNIAEPVPGIPAAYQLQAADASADTSSADSSDTSSADESTESDGTDATDSENTDGNTDDETVMLQYVNSTEVSMTLQGTESQIRAFLDDIAKNYPGIQVRSFDMQEQTYVDSNLKTVGQMNCACVLSIYTCGEINTTETGEENSN